MRGVRREMELFCGMPAWWYESFRPFSLMHLITVGACIVLIAASTRAGCRWRGLHHENRLRYAWVAVCLLFQVSVTAWYLTPGVFRWDTSLPLQVCDLAAYIGPLALLTQARWLRSLLYFWGIGLSTQAFFTPIITEGPSTARFWMFWFGHLIIVGSAIYDTVVLCYRPKWRDLATTLAISIGYILVMAGVDWAFGLNYAFVGPKEPETPTIVQKLGAWPWRVFVMIAIGTAAFVVLWGVWGVARMRRRGEGDAG